MGKKRLGGEIVLDYLKEYTQNGKLTISKKALARVIYKENPEIWTNVEAVRSAIRLQTGALGESNRDNTPSKDFFDYDSGQGKYMIPQTDAEPRRDFVIPKAQNKILILSDIHIPYHDVDALNLALEYGEAQGVNAIYLNGDIMDCYTLSKYEKDPRKRSFNEELQATRQFLKGLTDNFSCPIYYKIGNHEARYEAFLKSKAKELLDLDEFRLDVLLRFGELGIQLVESHQMTQAGNIYILHGHEKPMGGVHPARTMQLRLRTSAIAGHNHRTSDSSWQDLNGKIKATFSTGCLCEMNPEYGPLAFLDWNHGFAILEVYKDGSFKVDNLRIINGEVR